MTESPEPQDQPGETQPDEGIVPEQEEGTPAEDIEDPAGPGEEAPTG